MNSLTRRVFACAIAIMAALSIVSCSDNQSSGEINVKGDQAAMVFSEPAILMQSRAFLEDELILQVTIEGEVITVPRNSNGEYIFRTTVTPNTSSAVTVEWFQMVGTGASAEMLLLASATRTLNVGSVSSPATLTFSQYNTAHDRDDDGFSNLQELREGTNALDGGDRESGPVIVALSVRFSLPSELENASDLIRSAISARASVNDEPILLSRDGDQWLGTTTLPENSDPLIIAEFFATEEQQLQVAEFFFSQNVGSGAEIVFGGDQYESDRFNEDGDGFNNAEEIARGSDPFDSTDPDGDGDRVADESDNCPAAPNSNQADADNDGLGDVCDPFNNLVDPDEDTISNSASPPDNCPTVPNTNQRDEDGDGIGDACDDSNGLDPDNDQVNNPQDNCPTDANNNQADIDDDGIGDACDPFNNITDPDMDGFATNGTPPDNCPGVANPNQLDSDGDGMGDACEVPNVAPVADAGPDQTIVEGTTLRLDGTGSTDSDGTIVSFLWFLGQRGVGSVASPTVADLPVGVHRIDLRVTDNEGGTGTDQMQVTVTAAPIPNVPPTAEAGPNQSVVVGTEVILNGRDSRDSDGTIVSYQWTENGVEIATGATATIQNPTAGTRTIQLNVTDDDGGTGSDQMTVTVTVEPIPNVLPTANAGPDQTVVAGTDVLLDGRGSSDGDGNSLTYQWREDGMLIAVGATPTVSDLAVGPHNIVLTVTDPDGGSDTDQMTVTVTEPPVANARPTANAGPNQSVVVGTAVVLDGRGSTDSDGTIVSYQWTENGVEIATGATATIQTPTVGSRTIQLNVTDNEGGTGSGVTVVTVTAAPVSNSPPTANAGADQSVVVGNAVVLDGSGSTDSDGTIASYQWTENGVEIATGVTATIQNPTAGSRTIQLNVTDDDGTTATDQMTVTVTAAPVANVPPTADAGPDQTVVVGTAVLLDGRGSSDGDGTSLIYQWREDGVVIAMGATATIPDFTVGVHNIELTVTDPDGATATDQMTVTVTAAPVANVPPTADAGPDQTVVVGTAVLLDGRGSSDGDGTSLIYQWSEDGVVIAMGATATISDFTVGVHNIELTVTDPDSATATDQMTVTVNAAPVANAPPTADAGLDQTVVQGTDVVLDGSGSTDSDGTIVSYQWTENGVEIATGVMPTIADLVEGSYTIDLIVTDDMGATGTDQLLVTVTGGFAPPTSPGQP